MTAPRPGTIFYRPGDVLLFYDDRSPPDPGTGQHGVPAINRGAMLAGLEGALLLERGMFGRRVRRIAADQISDLKNVTVRGTPGQHGQRIAEYFIKHVHKPSHFEAGMAALYCGNLDPFLRGQLYPIFPIYRNQEEYDRAWDNFCSLLKPMDFILALDRSSRISKFIALATHGPWSHVGVYLGNCEMSEMLTTGVRRGP